jgi:hypothetical protein
MQILAIVSGEYGRRHVENIQKHAPETWTIKTWQAPRILPAMIDDPEDFLPDTFEPADLILSFAEHRGVAELIPEMVQMSAAKAVVAAVDDETWLPRGLARQLRGWLKDMGIACATPKPLCSLTEVDFGVTLRERLEHGDEHIAEFARYFGQPRLELTLDPETCQITQVEVGRDAVCGCARYVAEQLIGLNADEAEEKAGLLHHHYPCMASMGKDPDFNQDTLMHASGNIIKDNVQEQVKPYRNFQYISPGKRSQDP